MTATVEQELTARHVTGLEPGTAGWLKKMSASKVSAVLGLSPYESPFSLYHRMRGEVDQQPTNENMERGLYLEPGILAWFRDQHPTWTYPITNGTWQHLERDWQIASPDALAVPEEGTPLVGVEIKTASDDSEWGDPLTDEIPVGYRAQVMWQMDVVGTRVTHIAVLSAYLELREYVVAYDATEADYIRERCADFLRDVTEGNRPPIDGHTETYLAVKSLHPLISPDDVELDAETARLYCEAKALAKQAKRSEQLATSVVADLLGNARRARFGNQTIAYRQAKGEGLPYLVAGRNLPDFPEGDA